jgi:TDG/mug DNA glycosylase family protein
LPIAQILTCEFQASELSSSERASSVPALLSKLAIHRPKFLCLVGTSNWDVVRKALLQMSTGPSKASGSTSRASVGLQPFKICYPPIAGPAGDTSADISETLLFVVPSTSGRVVHYQVRILPSLSYFLVIYYYISSPIKSSSSLS